MKVLLCLNLALTLTMAASRDARADHANESTRSIVDSAAHRIAGCDCNDKQCWNLKISLYQISTWLYAIKVGTLKLSHGTTGVIQSLVNDLKCALGALPIDLVIPTVHCVEEAYGHGGWTAVAGCRGGLIAALGRVPEGKVCLGTKKVAEAVEQAVAVGTAIEGGLLVLEGQMLLYPSLACAAQDLTDLRRSNQDVKRGCLKPATSRLMNQSRVNACRYLEMVQKGSLRFDVGGCTKHCSEPEWAGPRSPFRTQADDPWASEQIALALKALGRGREDHSEQGEYARACEAACSGCVADQGSTVCERYLKPNPAQNHFRSHEFVTDTAIERSFQPLWEGFQKWRKTPPEKREKNALFSDYEDYLKRHPEFSSDDQSRAKLAVAHCALMNRAERNRISHHVEVLAKNFDVLLTRYRGPSMGTVPTFDWKKLSQSDKWGDPELKEAVRALAFDRDGYYMKLLDNAAADFLSQRKDDGIVAWSDVKAYQDEIEQHVSSCERVNALPR